MCVLFRLASVGIAPLAPRVAASGLLPTIEVHGAPFARAGTTTGAQPTARSARNATRSQPAGEWRETHIYGGVMRRGGDIDRMIARIATANRGVVSVSALAAAGVGRRPVEDRVSIGRLHRVHGGVYLLVPPQDATRIALFAAAVVACGGDARLSHFSAAELWGLLARRPGDAEVDVMVAGRNPGTRSGIRRRRVAALHEHDVRVREGIAATSPARTLLDLAADLAGADLSQLVASARSERLADARHVQAVLERYPRHRGAARLKAVMQTPGGPQLTRSKNERSVLSLVRQARLKPPAMNVRPAGFEVDACWPQERLVVEADGYEFHRDRAAFENDRARDATLVAAGFRVIRVTWRQLDEEPFVVVGRIAQALGVAGAHAASARTG